MNVAVLTRWMARVLSILILGFWGFFIVAHLVGQEGQASRPLHGGDYIALAAMASWLVGLAVAWKWELAGGAISLLALLAAGAVNGRILVFPGVLIATTAALFMVSWWLHSSDHERGSVIHERFG